MARNEHIGSPEVSPHEMIKNYVFTFTQRSELKEYYITIRDTYSSARNRMCEIFGDKWAFQYENEAKAGVKMFNLKCLITL